MVVSGTGMVGYWPGYCLGTLQEPYRTLLVYGHSQAILRQYPGNSRAIWHVYGTFRIIQAWISYMAVVAKLLCRAICRCSAVSS